MAELIDKGALKEMFPCNGEGSWTYNVTAKAYIDSLPTTTETEIRNKAISEFAKKLQMHLADWQLTETDYDVRFTIDEAIKAVDEIAEQLKEGE